MAFYALLTLVPYASGTATGKHRMPMHEGGSQRDAPPDGERRTD